MISLQTLTLEKKAHRHPLMDLHLHLDLSDPSPPPPPPPKRRKPTSNPNPNPRSSPLLHLDLFPSSPLPPKQVNPSSNDLNLTLSLSTTTTTIAAASATTTTKVEEDRGIKLIHLLISCASHTASDDLHKADACLDFISSLSSLSGDSMQRLAAHLAASLAARLLLCRRLPGLLSSLHNPNRRQSMNRDHLVFARALPYLPFARAIACRTLLRAILHESNIHAVDLGGASTAAAADLWSPILRTLSRVPRRRFLRLTCLGDDIESLRSLGSSLTKEAKALDVPFQFQPVLASSLTQLDTNSLDVRSGEALVAVSMLKLHELLAEEEGKKMARFLEELRGWRPKVVVVAEQEAESNGKGVVERVVEGLHHYSAVFDSVEAAAKAGMVGEEERRAVEMAVGSEMENMVAREGKERVERHERKERWMERMAMAGFEQAKVSGDAVEEGRRVLDAWNGGDAGGGGGGGEGYGVVVEKGCVMICWHEKPLYTVSAWH